MLMSQDVFDKYKVKASKSESHHLFLLLLIFDMKLIEMQFRPVKR